MADAKTGLTDAIRDVLSEADDSLTMREIVDILTARGVPCANTSAILRQRKTAGEFIQGEIRGVLAYTLNPEFDAAALRDRKRGRPRKVAAAPAAPVKTAPPPLAPALAPAPAPAAAEAGEYQRRPAPEIDPQLQVEQDAAAAPPPPPSAPPPRRRPPLALGDRLDAIANDIEEAIADACDACLGHELIKALVLANGATHRALAKLDA